jgi:hypothetical protein
VRDDKDGDKGFAFPKWFTPVLTSAFIAIAGAAFQMYTDQALIKQEQSASARLDDKRDARLDTFDQRLSNLERGQDEFHKQAIDKLNYIADRHRK